VKKKQKKRCREERCSSSKVLSKETISQYFYMLIPQAAKELNVGLALLKKRCRKQGFCRWPHRKLMSLHISSARGRADGDDDGKPHCYRTKNLTRPVPASDFDWKRWRYHPHLVKAEDCFESVSPPSIPRHLESQKDPVPLERVWFLHPHSCLKHITLRVDCIGDEDWEYSWRIRNLKGPKGLYVKGITSYPTYIEGKLVAFNLCRFPRNATDKTTLVQFPTPSATIRFQ